MDSYMIFQKNHQKLNNRLSLQVPPGQLTFDWNQFLPKIKNKIKSLNTKPSGGKKNHQT